MSTLTASQNATPVCQFKSKTSTLEMSSQATAKANKKAVNCRIRYENEGDYSAVKGRDMLQVPQDKAFKNQNMPRENLSQN